MRAQVIVTPRERVMVSTPVLATQSPEGFFFFCCNQELAPSRGHFRWFDWLGHQNQACVFLVITKNFPASGSWGPGAEKRRYRTSLTRGTPLCSSPSLRTRCSCAGPRGRRPPCTSWWCTPWSYCSPWARPKVCAPSRLSLSVLRFSARSVVCLRRAGISSGVKLGMKRVKARRNPFSSNYNWNINIITHSSAL